MRYYSANINIAGDRNAVVNKTGMTAAEIMVLQAIHGHGEVYDIRRMPDKGRDNTPHEVVRDHLLKRYGKVRTGPSSDRRPVLVAVFPSWPNTTLPTDLDKAGIDPALFAEDNQPKKTRAKTGTSAAASQAEATDFTE